MPDNLSLESQIVEALDEAGALAVLVASRTPISRSIDPFVTDYDAIEPQFPNSRPSRHYKSS